MHSLALRLLYHGEVHVSVCWCSRRLNQWSEYREYLGAGPWKSPAVGLVSRCGNPDNITQATERQETSTEAQAVLPSPVLP
jgi:hypothetical protein